MSTYTTIAQVVGSALASGGLVAIVNSVANRRKVKVDAADRLSDGALKWVDQFQEEATEARREAAAARHEMHLVREEAKQLAADMYRLRRAILDPTTTLDRLRAMLSSDSPGNGTV